MLLLTCLFVGIALVTAQNQKVTGIVYSEEDGQPVVGASVLVKGTTIGTTTDIDGKFLLSVPSSGKTLKVSYIGMISQEVTVKPNLKISLKSNAQVTDEVIVVAYGTSKKSSFTGSASSIKADALDKLPVSSFEKALQGLSPGVQVSSVSGQPGSQTQIRIRGVGSLTASSAPLYVIDGVPISSDNLSEVANADAHGTSSNPLASLNPNDIESMTILKDASAASLYGSRAANGVILITTKKGTSGDAKISFKANFSSSKLPSGGYDLMNASEHYGLYYKGYLSLQPAGTDPTVASAAANSKVQKLYRRNPYNVANPLNFDGSLAKDAQLMIDTDWLGEIFKGGVTQEYNLGINGGNDKTQYFISLGYLDQEGIVIGSDFNRYSGRANVSSKLRSWLSAGINTTFSMSNQNTPVGGGGGASPLVAGLYMPNTVPLYSLDNKFNVINDKNGNPMYNYVNPIFSDMNAVGFSKVDTYLTKTYRVLVSPYVNVELLKNLNWRTTISSDYSNLDETQWYNPEHGNGKSAEGRLYKYAIWDVTNTLSTTLTYDYKLNGGHSFNFLLGYEAMQDKYNKTVAQGTKFPAGGLVELDVAATPQSVGSRTDTESMLSYLGRINYDYMQKYYASFSMRTDASSKFPTDNQYGTFWSTGASWRISEEPFMKSMDWINDLKLRASYGTSGNKSGIGLYDWQGLYEGGHNYNSKPGISHKQIENRDFSWETSKNLNVGVDFGFFERFNLSVEFYQKKSDKLLLDKKLPLSNGVETQASNLGGMSNTGVEVDFKSINIKTKDFTWNTDFNFSYNKNKITSYPQKEEIVGTKIRTVGYDLYEFYIQEWAGVNKETGAPLWYMDEVVNNVPTGNRVTTSNYSLASKYKMGSALHNICGALNNTMSYKGFEFSFLFTCGLGGKIYDGYEAYLVNDGNSSGYQAIKSQSDYWTPQNKDSKNPKFVPGNTSGSNKVSSRYLHDAGYLKLRNISLNYSLPTAIIRKVGLNNVRLSASFENVANWNFDKEFKGYDVELGGISGSLDGQGTIPNPKTVQFGVSVNF